VLRDSLLTAIVLAAGQPWSLPAAVEPEVVGAWSCGETRIEITPEGAIELEGEEARGGLVRATAGRLVIFWSAGGESEWAYAAGEGALVLGTDRGPNYACLIEKK
jgi:hypothetical protein